ncbi:MAG: hypothetical protein JKX95_03270, partial [Bacteroidia bacterium]|nr:hypothetical protein [Bacteroidia bacterium]
MTAKTSSSNDRISFASIKHAIDYPDFLDVQLESFENFFQLGTASENLKNENLYKIFCEHYPINDARNIFTLEFIEYTIDPPRYTMVECVQRGLTYSIPLKIKFKLS